ncbi:MAG: hypothetical protein ACUZ8H_14245 [Candidatus Anammoxibacter sp.]
MERLIGKHARIGSMPDNHAISGDRMLPIANNRKKKRSCLMCGKMFTSCGPFNRRCSKCSRLVEFGKGGCVNMPHVYKLSSRDSGEIFAHNDLVYKKV